MNLPTLNVHNSIPIIPSTIVADLAPCINRILFLDSQIKTKIVIIAISKTRIEEFFINQNLSFNN
jgi:hypothetical protein